jgi:O-antigen/teichoic acid export membrane protein
MSLERRILSGTMANMAGIVMNAVLQVVTVPVLLSAWGAEAFGLWVMLTTIPTYFALTDLGFLQATTSEMAMRFARQEKAGAARVFFSSSALIMLVCLFFFAVTGSIASGLSAGGLLPPGVELSVLLLLAAYSALSLLSRLPVAALRASGHYALGTVSLDTMGLLEGLAGLATALLGGGFADVALCVLLVRLVTVVLLSLLLWHKLEWLRPQTVAATADRRAMPSVDIREIRALARPALAAMAIPLALALNLQGVVLIVGALLSPAAVAVYGPVRTCSRLLIQLIGVVNRASMPELSRARAGEQPDDLRRLLKANGLLLLLVLLPGSLAFAALGRQVVGLWSAGHILPDQSFVALVALATLVHGTWYFLSNILLATNDHLALAKYSLGAAVLTLGLVAFLAGTMGLVGVGLALLLGEGLCAIAVCRIFLAHYRQVLQWT